MANETQAVNPIMAFKGHTQAMAFARKGGAAFGELLFSIAKRKEEEGKGPIETLLFLETHFSDEEGHNIPVVGSKMGETGNLPYDRYTTEVQTADGKRKVPGSWFTDVVKSTEQWAILNQRREYVKQGQGEGVPADILAMNAGERAMEKKRIDTFITNMRTALTKGAMLLHQVEAVDTMNPARVKVKLPIFEEKGTDGKPRQVVKGNLIRLVDPSGLDAEGDVFSVGSFLRFDPVKAAADPDKGTITSLKATASRGPRKPPAAAGTGTNYAIPTTLEGTMTLFNVLASAMDNTQDHGKKMESQLLTALAKTTKDGDEAVISVGKLCLALDSVWTVISDRYDRITRAQAAAANTKVA